MSLVVNIILSMLVLGFIISIICSLGSGDIKYKIFYFIFMLVIFICMVFLIILRSHLHI